MGIDRERIANDQPKGIDHVVELIMGSGGGAGRLSLGKVQAVGEHAVDGGDKSQAKPQTAWTLSGPKLPAPLPPPSISSTTWSIPSGRSLPHSSHFQCPLSMPVFWL